MTFVFADLTISQVGSDVEIAFGTSDITLEDTNIAQINANDFIFV